MTVSKWEKEMGAKMPAKYEFNPTDYTFENPCVWGYKKREYDNRTSLRYGVVRRMLRELFIHICIAFAAGCGERRTYIVKSGELYRTDNGYVEWTTINEEFGWMVVPISWYSGFILYFLLMSFLITRM